MIAQRRSHIINTGLRNMRGIKCAHFTLTAVIETQACIRVRSNHRAIQAHRGTLLSRTRLNFVLCLAYITTELFRFSEMLLKQNK